MRIFTQGLAWLGCLQLSLTAAASYQNTTDVNGMDFVYPYPVHFYRFASQSQKLEMAYMDVRPASEENGIIVLLHGKNFCGATWNATIKALVDNGHRVIVPDQIGFCKSSKPSSYQFSLMQLGLNTNGLLNSLNITSAIIMGHSMGGMISTRYALMFPSQTERLILVDPLGLENWFAKGVPYQSIDVSYQTELNTTFASIKSYEQSTYYADTWEPEYDVWVNMLLSVYQGSEGSTFAFDMALTTDMIFTQPIIYELSNLTMPTLLMVGDKDNTAIGKKWAPANIQPLLGHYEVLGKEAAAMIANCTLVEFPLLGHAPHIQDPATFQTALFNWLDNV